MPDDRSPGSTGWDASVGSTPEPAVTEVVAALGRDLDRLRHAVSETDVRALRSELTGLAVTVAGLAEQVAELADAGNRDEPAPSWLWPLDPGAADRLLAGLVEWARHVYVAFPDGRLPGCWLWHPHVVEELVWLWRAWLAAYRGMAASPQRAADWHDRLRPGVSRRIGAAVGACSLRAHLAPMPAPQVPGADATDVIATWRAEPGRSAPVPTAEQVASADRAEVAAAWT